MAKAKSAKKAGKKASKNLSKKDSKKALKKASKKVSKKVSKKSAKKSVKPSKRAGKRFLIIYHVPADAMAQTADASPEEQAAGMALWTAWAERVANNLADLGAPLINGKSLSPLGDTSPSIKEVAGYSLLDAEDWEEVLELVKTNPHISGWHPSATIEIHETMLLPGM